MSLANGYMTMYPQITLVIVNYKHARGPDMYFEKIIFTSNVVIYIYEFNEIQNCIQPSIQTVSVFLNSTRRRSPVLACNQKHIDILLIGHS